MVHKQRLCGFVRCTMRIIDAIKERFELVGLGLALFLLNVKDRGGGF